MAHPPGSIIIATGDLTRYASFCRSLTSLHRPEGTGLVWSYGSDIVFGFNQALRQRQGEWVWIMADDHVFAPDLLMRLLDREVDVVSPVVTNRKPPFCIFAFEEDADGGLAIVPFERLPTAGLHAFDGCSGAGLLIREHVLQAVGEPFYEAGQVRVDQLNEDTWLMKKIRRAGFKIHIDFDCRMGHQTPVTVWPTVGQDGRWQISADFWCTIPSAAHLTP
jgi:cellulose synthase/poly-beta-1,6-N-acetylglucosamine synthase-like glycosyltransferase